MRLSLNTVVKNFAVLATLLFAVLIVCFIPAAAQTSSFQGLGQMPGAMIGAGSFASAISSDGSTIVGYAWVCPNGGTNCSSTGKTEAFRWTAAGKYEVLGDLGNEIGSMGLAISANGSVIVGNAPDGANDFGAFRWTANGMVALPVSLLFGSAVTGDGNMVAGGDIWWNATGETGKFGPFPGNPDQTQAFGLAGTASNPVAVGGALKGTDGAGPTYHAFLWTPSSGLEDLGLTTGTQSIATAISADESTVVGEATSSANGFFFASRWTAATGMKGLGTLGGPSSIAYATNQDGSVVVGTSLTSVKSDSNDAFIWTTKHGLRSLRAVLQQQGVHTADTWVQVTSATGISADGTVITGFGISPRTKEFPFGVQTPFRVVLREP
jgi:uncharacterized membrane protein